ncbi:MAG: glycine--tRNA ligase subunit beta, partial [Pseudomonadota bacterium]
MPELLIEFLSEEIPARMQADAEAQLEARVVQALADADVTHGAVRRLSTPRRIALALSDVAAERPPRAEERKGPKVGAPEQALAGFLRSAGLERIEQCEVRTVGKADVYFAVKTVPGGPTRDILLDLLRGVAERFSWPKSMRWGAGRRSWVRPLKRVLCVLDGAPVTGEIDYGGCLLPVGGETEGHSFLAPRRVSPTDAASYLNTLRDAKVLSDRSERRDRIAEGAVAAAAQAGLRLKHDPGLLDEAAGLVEWPVPLLGRIDDAFMDLPPEVLVTSMRSHQKYFAVEDSGGGLANRFVVVANMATADDGAAIVAGNERVLRARLSDARFFWDQDRARPLDERLPDLERITFHAKLGSVEDRAKRIARLSRFIADALGDPQPEWAERAGLLAKADLTTGMVGEFP